MCKVLIIGGGFAGLTAAVYLSQYGCKVKLLESSPKLGGRAYSFTDESTGDIIDNGQHILLGCYRETLRFLNLIGSSVNISIQSKLKIVFTDRQKGNISLKAITGLYPFNLLLGILNFKALKIRERFGIIKFFTKLFLNRKKNLIGLSVKEWLQEEKQSANVITAFWEIITVGALNTDTSKASALIFHNILQEIFISNSNSASIILPKTGLSEMYCDYAKEYIRKNGGEICLSSPVEKISIVENTIQSVIINGKEYSDFDFLISSVPYHAIRKFNLPEDIMTGKFIPSSILSVHLWLKNNPFTEEFYGLINSELHWIFNHGKYITIVISNADRFMQMEKSEIFSIIKNEIGNYFSFFNDELISGFRIIKEKRATFVPSNEIADKRPGTETKIKNLYLAGDWTNTGLPATIESAVKSGRIAAEAVISQVRK